MTGPVLMAEALTVTRDGDGWLTTVHDGYDVFGIPHGGYLAALASNAVLHASGQPDLFTVTTHYLRKASLGPLRWVVRPVGSSRRFATWMATGYQNDKVILSTMASVGDRTAFEGPHWSTVRAPEVPPDAIQSDLGERAPIPVAAIAQRVNLEFDKTCLAFVEGRKTDEAVLRAVAHFDPVDQLAGIIACDVTPPAAWNALGVGGWVPTVELTAHLRARPVPGPVRIHVETRAIDAGFLEEDGLVFDAHGTLFVQSRQLARWTNT